VRRRRGSRCKSWCIMRRSKKWMCGEVYSYIPGSWSRCRPCRAELLTLLLPSRSPSHQSRRHNRGDLANPIPMTCCISPHEHARSSQRTSVIRGKQTSFFDMASRGPAVAGLAASYYCASSSRMMVVYSSKS
jgi:hypothetical protein